ncbi:hypothetical protein PPL_05018 [Heterostelium album PN500]|uniref:B box-type domain-containing protein n=1 Tax=Heterostelium pallidum (strain ATCC 26659 / Pp 5 / PN500) TaxID=670386 RepID=D3B974_HETP5|nr:hypothetical protein PPL_05018 [Heterostelium album PN500]EFA82113.1 hypothetical protein PPL_05018 [Heterostelium album PN500]|eukprot:XP_020434230.1 hypothetical protein PPL_05018 [Heterostelium album PN500]
MNNIKLTIMTHIVKLIMTIKCLNHQKSHKFICYQCNHLMCSKCIFNHSKDQPDHFNQIEDIDEIKHSLSTLKLDDIIDTTTTTTNNHCSNNSNSNKNSNNFKSQINNKLKSLWESLRSSTSRYQRLSTTENEIKQHFEQLHQYLTTEEHKLQKDIFNDKHTIINQIDNNVKNLKYLINTINILNKLNNNNNNSSDNNDNNNISNEDTSIITDTTTFYSTTTIMESITTSSSLQSFINHNNQTLFYFDKNNNFNIDELTKQHSNSSTSLLLDIIHKYNNQFNESTTNTDNNNLTLSSYKLSIKQPDFNQLNSIIKQSIKLDKIEPTESIDTTTNNNDNKQSYIFTTHHEMGATLINTSNNNSIEELKFDYQFDSTAPSIVSIDEYIYIFGGTGNENKWIKISMKSKSIEHIGDIKGIRGDIYISVCYDGQDHIYLVNGYDIRRIDRFNIKTMKFESYHQLPYGYGMQVSSMIFKGSLYSVAFSPNLIFQFDLTNKTITDHQIDIKPWSGCHDNNGNFFILDMKNKRFIKYNVEANQTINLNVIPITYEQYTYVMYHRESPTSSYIYSFGSSNGCNFKYSIESNQCEPFFRDIINKNRACSASTSISF